jgi:low molecular weight protein-tyrosine phosphatase
VIRILFVCTGNICRSPTAEGVMRSLVAAAGLGDRVEIDSCGLGGWHVGEPPDPRTCATARRRGVELSHRARKLELRDLDRFDYVLAMDGEHLRELERLARGRASARIELLRGFDDNAADGAEVPDPYYGGADGFELVYDVCERACRGLLAHLTRELEAPA